MDLLLRESEECPVEKEGTGAGSVWTWTAIDADSKLVISYLCGGRDASWACKFMEDLASRVTTRIQITTDGHRAYAEAVEGAFGMDVDYAMLIKLYGAPSDNPETATAPPRALAFARASSAATPIVSTSQRATWSGKTLTADGRPSFHAPHQCFFEEV